MISYKNTATAIATVMSKVVEQHADDNNTQAMIRDLQMVLGKVVKRIGALTFMEIMDDFGTCMAHLIKQRIDNDVAVRQVLVTYFCYVPV